MQGTSRKNGRWSIRVLGVSNVGILADWLLLWNVWWDVR